MKTSQRYCRRFLQSRKAASALEYAILVGIILAGVGGVLIGFAEDVQAPIGPIGDGVAAIETPEIDITP